MNARIPCLVAALMRFSLLRSLSVAASLVPATMSAPAQEALRTSQAGETAAMALRRQQEDQSYTYKLGDFRLLVEPTLDVDWNDNVNLSRSKQQDLILRPLLNLRGSYPLTALNSLKFSIGVGYDYYTQHPDYSQLRLKENSELAFDIFIKDFWINLHDRFEYTQDPANHTAVAVGARYGGLNNYAGFTTVWDLKDLVLTLGYDHNNFVSSATQYEYLNRASELPMLRAGLRLHPRLTAGVEGTVSYTAYDQPVLNNSVGYSGGLYADWQPGPYFRLEPRGGYTVYDFQQTSHFTKAVDQSTWYAGLSISHLVNDSVTYSLNAGHELRLGISADYVEDTYFRPSATLKVIKNLPITTTFTYEHGTQGTGTHGEIYDYYGASLGLSYLLLKGLRVGLNYRITIRSSSTAGEYAQNLLSLRLNYHF